MKDSSVAVIVALSCVVFFAIEAVSGPPVAHWSIERGSTPEVVKLELLKRDGGSRHQTTRSDFPLRDLKGLTRAQMDSLRSTVKFEIARDTGKLLCEGSFVLGTGSGNFTFQPNPDFVAAMTKLGYDDLTQDVLFSMALDEVGLEFASAARGNGRGLVSVRELLSMRHHGVTADYIQQLRALGYEDYSAEDFKRLKSHGVTAQFVRELKDSGYVLSSEEFARLRSHGVEPRFAAELKQAGHDLAPDELIKLRNHGVSAQFARELKDLKLPVDDLTKLRDNGVPPEFVRQARELGYERFRTDELVRLHHHGVNGDYLRRLQGGGLKNLNVEQIVKLKTHGID